jgi:hypothetical protein
MQAKRLLASLILGLSLTSALCLLLSAERDAQATPLRADARRELVSQKFAPSPFEQIENQPSNSANSPESLPEGCSTHEHSFPILW